MTSTPVRPREDEAARRARVRLRRALRCDRAYAHRMTAQGVRLMRYTAHLAWLDLAALGLTEEARAIVRAHEAGAREASV